MRKVLGLALWFAAGIFPAGAQDYPNRPVKLIVPFAAGAGSDFTARVLAESLSTRLGQPVVVDNRPGAGGAIGTDNVAKATPDGYTLLWAASDAITMLPAVKANLPYRVPGDFSYIAKFTQTGLTVAVSSKLPVSNMAEFVAYAKANPGKIRYGTAGVGGSTHLATLLFEKAAGIKMVAVHYKGVAASLQDLLGGHIDIALVAPPTIMPHLNSDKVRVIGITAPTRHPFVPNAPTMTELGVPKATAVPWYGVLGPAGLPAAVTERLRKDVAAAAASPEANEKLSKAGWVAAPLIGDDLEKFVVEEFRQWKEIADAEKIVIEE
jgi:tripartite-type tricarboxylate transporter receptor subunit TctC